jgi:hypothetical protein
MWFYQSPWRSPIRHRRVTAEQTDQASYRSRDAGLAGYAGAPGLGLFTKVEHEDFYDAVCIAAMRLVCRPGNARNAVAIAAISATRQADKKT